MSDKVALVRLRAKNDDYDRAMRASAKATDDVTGSAKLLRKEGERPVVLSADPSGVRGGTATATGYVSAARLEAEAAMNLVADPKGIRTATTTATGYVVDLRSDGERIIDLDADPSGVRSGADDATRYLEQMRQAGTEAIVPRLDTTHLRDQADEGEQSLVSMIGRWETAAVAAGAVLAAKVGGAFVDAFQETIGTRAERDAQLTAALGLSPDESAVLGKMAGDLYAANFGESTADVNTALRESYLLIAGLGTASGFGEAGAQVNQLAGDALNMAKIFGVDATRAIQVAGVMIRNGLAKDGTEAMDLLTAALQKVPAELSGDVLDAIDEYGKHFKNLGLDGPRAIGLLVAASGNGTIAIDKVGDALKEFTIRGSDMSEASVAAYDTLGLNAQTMAERIAAGGDQAATGLDLVSDQLLAIKDPALQANTAIALFGAPLEDIGVENIPAFLLALQDGAGGIEGFSGAAAQAGTDLNDNLASKIDGVIRMLSPSALLDAFDQGGIDAVKARVQGGVDQLVAIWEQYGPAVTEMLQEAITAISNLWDEHGDEIIAKLEKWWNKTGGPAAQALISFALGVAWDGVREYFKDKVSDPDWWARLVAEGFYNPFTSEMGKIRDKMAFQASLWLEDLPLHVTQLAAGVWDPIGHAFESVINGIIDIWNALDFTFPSWTFLGVTYGGGTIGVPDLNHVQFMNTGLPGYQPGGRHNPPRSGPEGGRNRAESNDTRSGNAVPIYTTDPYAPITVTDPMAPVFDGGPTQRPGYRVSTDGLIWGTHWGGSKTGEAPNYAQAPATATIDYRRLAEEFARIQPPTINAPIDASGLTASQAFSLVSAALADDVHAIGWRG